MNQIGIRVGAILSANGKSCNFLGYGVYEGDFVPEEAVGGMAESLNKSKIPNPRIRLDNGKVVYGCECWWGPEENVKIKLEKYDIVEVDIDEVRKEYFKK